MESKTVEKIIEKHPEWTDLLKYGLNDPNWNEFLREIDSKEKYLKCVADYFRFHSGCANQDFSATIVMYFDVLHRAVNENGTRRFNSRTIKSMMSMLNPFRTGSV